MRKQAAVTPAKVSQVFKKVVKHFLEIGAKREVAGN
jgi:putative transposon-encoded protein